MKNSNLSELRSAPYGAMAIFCITRLLSSIFSYRFLIKNGPDGGLGYPDFDRYVSRYNFSLLHPSANGGFSLLLKFFGIETPDAAKAIAIAAIATLAGGLLLIYSAEQAIRQEGIRKNSHCVIIRIFSFLLAFNPYFTISSFKLSPESFIYLGIGFFWLYITRIRIEKLVPMGEDIIYAKFRYQAINQLLITLLAVICTIRNSLTLCFVSIPLLWGRRSFNNLGLNLFRFRGILDASRRGSAVPTGTSFLVGIMGFVNIALIAFSFWMLFGFAGTYITDSQKIGSIDHLGFINILIRIPEKLVYLFSAREGVAGCLSFTAEGCRGVALSSKPVVTNIIPAVFYLIYNLTGSLAILLCKKSKYNIYFLSVFPSVIPTLVGIAHLRYLYPLVPAITLGLSLLASNLLTRNVKKSPLATDSLYTQVK